MIKLDKVSVMNFENHFSKQYFCLGILMAILPMRKLRLWDLHLLLSLAIFIRQSGTREIL